MAPIGGVSLVAGTVKRHLYRGCKRYLEGMKLLVNE